jgi:hypothetical protein
MFRRTLLEPASKRNTRRWLTVVQSVAACALIGLAGTLASAASAPVSSRQSGHPDPLGLEASVSRAPSAAAQFAVTRPLGLPISPAPNSSTPQSETMPLLLFGAGLLLVSHVAKRGIARAD